MNAQRQPRCRGQSSAGSVDLAVGVTTTAGAGGEGGVEQMICVPQKRVEGVEMRRAASSRHQRLRGRAVVESIDSQSISGCSYFFQQ